MPGYLLWRAHQCRGRGATFVCALHAARSAAGVRATYLFVDDLNIVFIVLSTFVGFTTAPISASYISHEIETGKLTPAYVRFYHAMYQALDVRDESRAARRIISA